MLHAKEYGVVPPETVRLIEPLLPEKQLMLAVATADEVKAATGCVIVADDVAVQPLASVIVTL